MTPYLYVVSILPALWLIKRLIDWFSDDHRRAPYPPGPKPKPLIGNALDFPTSFAYEVYLEWGRRYKSDFVYASALGTKVLILNKLADADELFERRAAIYSDRPVIPMIKMMGWDYNFALLPYGKLWRYHRQICQENFRPEAIRNYYPPLLRKVQEMLSRLLKDPENFDQHNKMFSISAPMVTMYGYEVESFEDPCIIAADESIRLGSKLIYPGGTWLNVIPMLTKINVPSWVPGATTWEVAARVRKLSKEMERIPFKFVEKGVADGTASDSFVSRFLRRKEEIGTTDQEEQAIRNIASTVYGAASDTTISAIQSFFYQMAVHPDIQIRAQAQLDQVIGSERLPNFEDRPSLPFIEAVYREVLRMAPSFPLGVPHALTEDDHYKGYFIPKGTTVFSNIWAMSHDEELYPEPFQFKPDRFLNAEGELDDNGRVIAYGFGRRICVGKYIASATVWIVIASVLACFDIKNSKDESGKEIDISHEYDDFGALRHKSKFKCSFVPRSMKIKQLVLGDAN